MRLHCAAVYGTGSILDADNVFRCTSVFGAQILGNAPFALAVFID